MLLSTRPTSPGESSGPIPQAQRPCSIPESSMAKPNYSFEKRQRELEKKRKKQEKAARKTAPAPAPATAPQQEEPK
jgi:hypothetical protein